jgi:hypothetical protein
MSRFLAFVLLLCHTTDIDEVFLSSLLLREFKVELVVRMNTYINITWTSISTPDV